TRAAAPALAGGLHLVDQRVTSAFQDRLGAVPGAARARTLEAPIVLAVEILEDAVLVGEHRVPALNVCFDAKRAPRPPARKGRPKASRSPGLRRARSTAARSRIQRPPWHAGRHSAMCLPSWRRLLPSPRTTARHCGVCSHASGSRIPHVAGLPAGVSRTFAATPGFFGSASVTAAPVLSPPFWR